MINEVLTTCVSNAQIINPCILLSALNTQITHLHINTKHKDSVQNPWNILKTSTQLNSPWWPFQSGSVNKSKFKCYIRISNKIRFQSGLRGRRTILNLEHEHVLTLMSIYNSLGENSNDQLFLNSRSYSFSTNNINVGKPEPRQRSS